MKFKKGDRVESDTFGKGVVIECGCGLVAIEFDKFIGTIRFLDDGRYAKNLPVSLRLVERANTEPKWMPEPEELVLFRDALDDIWTPDYFYRYDPDCALPWQSKNASWEYCKPHPTHLNWVPWKEGDGLPTGTVLWKYSDGCISVCITQSNFKQPIAYCSINLTQSK